MTNEVGKALFSKAGELGIPVGFMCMKVWHHLCQLCGHFVCYVILDEAVGFMANHCLCLVICETIIFERP